MDFTVPPDDPAVASILIRPTLAFSNGSNAVQPCSVVAFSSWNRVGHLKFWLEPSHDSTRLGTVSPERCVRVTSALARRSRETRGVSSGARPLLARFLSAENAERDKEFTLLQAQARGDVSRPQCCFGAIACVRGPGRPHTVACART